MRRFFVGFLIVLPLLTSGCVVPHLIEMFKDPYGRHDSLTRVQREYTNALRWGQPDIAAQYVHPDLREEFIGHRQKFNEIRVTDYEVSKVTWGEDKATAILVVTYHAYSMATMLEKEIRETQHWVRLSPKLNDWVVRPKLNKLINSVAGR